MAARGQPRLQAAESGGTPRFPIPLSPLSFVRISQIVLQIEYLLVAACQGELTPG